MSRSDRGSVEELEFNTLTVAGLRHHKWKVRALAVMAVVVPQLIKVYLAHQGTIEWDFIVKALVSYAAAETLILAPSWLTKPWGNIISAYVIACIAALNGYDEVVQSTEFYKAAAALVPVLFLAFVIEKRQEYHSTDSVGRRVLIVANIIGMLWAGKACFDVLAFDDTKHASTTSIIFPVAFTVVSLTLSLVAPPLAEPETEIGDETPEPAG
jgi:hypothetical protein